uniref:F-box protein AT5G49610-like beta-propeller domain-containing protein n=1 Tax=Aegilops tauschii TaxID=37682 RepID=M8CRV5_AEGTA
MVRQVVPPEALLDSAEFELRGAVLCATGQQGHVHGACHSSPFKVVLMCHHFDENQLLTGVYAPETDTWGPLISRELPPYVSRGHSSTLVGNALYWPSVLSLITTIFRFDLDTQNLTVIDGPPSAYNYNKLQIIRAADGTVGVAILHHNNLQMWQRKVNSEGVAVWFRGKTVALRNILNIPPQTGRSAESLKLAGYDEDTDVILLARPYGVYMVQIKSMQSRKLNGTPSPNYFHPFRSFYPLDTAIAGGTNGAEMLG